MKLLTKAIEAKLPALYTNEDKPKEETPIIVKFFDPTGRYTFYVTEGEKREDGDWLFFGYVESAITPDFDELGYTTLSELESVKGKLGLGIERDLHYEGHTLDEVA